MAASEWSSVPADLMGEITRLLSTDADNIHIHQVCTHWRTLTSLPPFTRPLVLACRTSWSRSPAPASAEYSIWLSRGHKQVDVPGAPAGFVRCLGVSHGWLALAKETISRTDLVLWEPVSNTVVSLPFLSNSGPEIFQGFSGSNAMNRIFLLGDPLISSDWVAIATQAFLRSNSIESFDRVLFWRPGDDDWSIFGGISAISIASYEGKLYCLDGITKRMTVYDLSLLGRNEQPPYTIDLVRGLCKCNSYHSVHGVHLVTCKGDLLFVALWFQRHKFGHPTFAEVYKLKWTSYGQLELNERVINLGEYAILIGYDNSFALSAEEFPSVKRNHIYCLTRAHNAYEKNGLYWALVFDLESGALEKIPYPEDLQNEGAIWAPCSWFCPTSSFVKLST